MNPEPERWVGVSTCQLFLVTALLPLVVAAANNQVDRTYAHQVADRWPYAFVALFIAITLIAVGSGVRGWLDGWNVAFRETVLLAFMSLVAVGGAFGTALAITEPVTQPIVVTTLFVGGLGWLYSLGLRLVFERTP